ncbi:uncharacterized protein [Eucyclogobius newberryi]|uniref:uncharacterized protein n=1 Tax=Eucyclogobius newberryi TaxID=166745 RepID=UPI003B5C6BAE
MRPVWTLLLLHIVHTRGAEDVCDARVNQTQCYGALGGTIAIRLMDSGSTTNRCTWMKNQTVIFECRNNIVKTNAIENRSVFNESTGILQLQNLTKSDNSSYSLEFYNDGKFIKRIYHKLIIEAPVSSVLLEHQCLSKGEVRATCAPQGGDSPEYNWTLNGQTHTDAELLSKNNENNIITLRQNTEGRLRCSVRNHISQESKEIQISTCGYILINCTINGTEISDWVYKANNTLCFEQTTATSIPSADYWPVLVGSLATVLIIGVAIFIVLKKCKKKRNEEEDQELTYADVRILRQPGRRLQTSEGEVEYGQVNFSNQSPHISVAEDNACIYAKVRR